MNKLLFPNGGMPVFLDDLAFVQSAEFDAFKGIIRAVADAYSGNLILGGCVLTEPTSTTATLSEGWVMLGYEIYYVPGNTVSKPAGPSYTGEIQPDVYLDAAGNRTFGNGSSQNPWQVRRAKLGPYATVSDAYINMPTVQKLPRAIANTIKPEVDTVTLSGFINGWSASTPVPKAFRQLAMVHLTGTIAGGSISTTSWTTLVVLPVGYRPANPVTTIVEIEDSGGAIELAHIKIDTDGTMTARKTNGAFSQAKLYFGFTFLAA